MKALIISLILLVATSSCTSPEYKITTSVGSAIETKTGDASRFQLATFEAIARRINQDSNCNYVVIEWVYNSKRDTVYSFTRQ